MDIDLSPSTRLYIGRSDNKKPYTQHCTARVREDIILEIDELTAEWEDITQSWFDNLPLHCQAAYQQPKMITQIPALHHLLTTIQYPHATLLLKELTNGFPLIGDPTRTELEGPHRHQIHRGPEENRTAHVQQTIHPEEIAKEVTMSRMDGPFLAPDWWTTQSVPLHKHQHTQKLKPLPHADPVRTCI